VNFSIDSFVLIGGNLLVDFQGCKMSGAASAIFLMDMKGRVLIWRDYRGDVSAPQAERAFAKLMEGEV